MKKIFKNKIKSFIGSVLVLLVGAIAPTAAAAASYDTNYCVYAKTGIGFVIVADWYNDTGKSVRRDEIPVWQWQCAPTGATTVKLSVLSGNIGNEVIKATLLGATAGAAAVACAGTAGLACAAAVAGGSAAADHMINAIPDAAGQFFKGAVNERKEYIEVWGTMWDPQVFLNGHKCEGC